MNSSVLIDSNGSFNRRIEEELNLSDDHSRVVVVSIIGAQSTGKSTFLNLVFNTNFDEMDGRGERTQTTKGILVAKRSTGQRCTIVIDTQGSDGREGDENFDKQTALFALAISDIVIVNMMCTDIGRENGAGWPLLRTAFQVMLQRFSTPREVTLLFVLRDKTESLSGVLEGQVKRELYQMLDEMTRTQAPGNARLDHRMKVKVVTTSHYLYKKEDFLKEVDDLREWIINYTSSAKGAAEWGAASDFIQYAATIWDVIEKDEDLNLPSYRIMVAEVGCKSIAKKKLECFCKNESWLQIKKDVESGEVVQGFGKEVNSLIDNCLSQYHAEALHYDETKRIESSKQLTENLLQVVKPIYLSVVKQMRNAILEKFQEAAGEELMSNGVLKNTKPRKFIAEFRNQLEEAAIKHANWNRNTEQLNQLQSEIKRFIDFIGHYAEHIQDKKQTQEFWLKILTVGLCFAASIYGAEAGVTPFVASAASIMSTLQNLPDIMKLVAQNQAKVDL